MYSISTVLLQNPTASGQKLRVVSNIKNAGQINKE